MSKQAGCAPVLAIVSRKPDQALAYAEKNTPDGAFSN
jgi:hypothetical protein